MSWWIHVYSMAFGRYKLWSMINGDYKSTSNCGAHLVWNSELIILSYHDTERTHIVLVGGFNPSEKYEFVSWDDDIPIYMEK